MSGAAALQRRYARLLVAYPRSYRSSHGAELIGTLMEVSGPDQSKPRVREGLALVAEGLRTRLLGQTASTTRAWVDGLHLGVFLLALANLTRGVGGYWTWPWLAVLAITVLATLKGWVWAALPAAVVGAAQVCRPLLHDVLPPAVNRLPFFGPGYGDLSAVAGFLTVAVGLVGLLVLTRGRHLRRSRSWWWLAVPAAAGVVTATGLGFSFVPVTIAAVTGTTPAEAGLASGLINTSQQVGGALGLAILASIPVLLLIAALTATLLTGDPRWAVAAGVNVVPGLVWLGESLQDHTIHDGRALVYFAVVATGTLAVVAAAGHRSYRCTDCGS